jgi:IS30 family transposase
MHVPTRKNGKLNAADRHFIERSIDERIRISEIAARLGVSISTVIREIKTNGTTENVSYLAVNTRNVCVKRKHCSVMCLCDNGCLVKCSKCKEWKCNVLCPQFEPETCKSLDKPPYCCNTCHRRYGAGCEYEYRFYDAKVANELSMKRRVEARRGIDRSEQELLEMARSIKPLLAKGQSPQAIWTALGDKLPISPRTFYRYVEMGVFEDILNINLPRKVRFKVRKYARKADSHKVDLTGRTYDDFASLAFSEQMDAVEMDLVVSAYGSSKAILTLLFRRFSLQLMVLLPDKSQESVAKALDMIEEEIGIRQFRKWFGVILTDRGSEFLDYKLLEKSVRRKKTRCKVYYCEPMKSGQKGRCEKNHVELRKILPKGTCFENLDAYKLAVVCSHVNSYSRPSLGGASPLQLAMHSLPKGLLDLLGVEYVPPEEVVMKPSLINL